MGWHEENGVEKNSSVNKDEKLIRINNLVGFFFKIVARNEILLYYDIRRCCNGWKTKNI